MDFLTVFLRFSKMSHQLIHVHIYTVSHVCFVLFTDFIISYMLHIIYQITECLNASLPVCTFYLHYELIISQNLLVSCQTQPSLSVAVQHTYFRTLFSHGEPRKFYETIIRLFEISSMFIIYTCYKYFVEQIKMYGPYFMYRHCRFIVTYSIQTVTVLADISVVIDIYRLDFIVCNVF